MAAAQSLAQDLDVVVCKKLFGVLEKSTSFEESRMVWTRFVRPDENVDKGGKSALLIARCEKVDGLRAQLCLIPLSTEKSKRTEKNMLWTTSLRASKLAEHFKSLGVTIDREEVAEEMTATFAHTLKTKDTITYKHTKGAGTLLLEMSHMLDAATTIHGELLFELSCSEVDDIFVNLVMDMSFALLDTKMRATKHKEYMLSKEANQNAGWLQTLEQEDAPLVTKLASALPKEAGTAEGDDASPSEPSPSKPVKRKHAPVHRGRRTLPKFAKTE